MPVLVLVDMIKCVMGSQGSRLDLFFFSMCFSHSVYLNFIRKFKNKEVPRLYLSQGVASEAGQAS